VKTEKAAATTTTTTTKAKWQIRKPRTASETGLPENKFTGLR